MVDKVTHGDPTLYTLMDELKTASEDYQKADAALKNAQEVLAIAGKNQAAAELAVLHHICPTDKRHGANNG